jgi:hypothetical protein
MFISVKVAICPGDSALADGILELYGTERLVSLPVDGIGAV